MDVIVIMKHVYNKFNDNLKVLVKQTKIKNLL